MDRGRYPRDERDDERAYDDAYAADDDYDAPYADGPAYDGEMGEYTDAPYQGFGDAGEHALLPLDYSAGLPALPQEDQVAPFIIPGTGVSMGDPFIRRRERPLTMRLAVITLTTCILVTGLFAVTPIGSSAESGLSSFQAISGAVVYHKTISFHWYVAQAGDSLESIATSQHVEIGGIYELNGLLVGQDITVGKAYKIPDDPFYGKDFRPKSLVVGGGGKTVLGDSPWTSIAGDPLPYALCGPDGNGYPPAYRFVSPNPHSNWVRGFTWYHNGVDISASYGNPIRAAQAGEVIWSGWDFYGLGYSVKINNCNHIATLYGHMSQLNVKAGDNVTAGQIIGLEGSTGNSTGPHLHFMVEWDNVPIDPMPYYNYSICSVTGYC